MLKGRLSISGARFLPRQCPCLFSPSASHRDVPVGTSPSLLDHCVRDPRVVTSENRLRSRAVPCTQSGLQSKGLRSYLVPHSHATDYPQREEPLGKPVPTFLPRRRIAAVAAVCDLTDAVSIFQRGFVCMCVGALSIAVITLNPKPSRDKFRRAPRSRSGRSNAVLFRAQADHLHHIVVISLIVIMFMFYVMCCYHWFIVIVIVNCSPILCTILDVIHRWADSTRSMASSAMHNSYHYRNIISLSLYICMYVCVYIYIYIYIYI